MLRWLQERARVRRIGGVFYDSIVAQSRTEAFYRELRVPDTMEGRFELIVLHVHLVLERLRRDGATGQAMSRALIESFVADIDGNMREIGISDLGVPRRVKRAAAALFERARTYAAAQNAPGSPDALPDALAEHIYGPDRPDPELPKRLARYVCDAAESLARQPSPVLLGGHLQFPDVAAIAMRPAAAEPE